MNMHIWHAVRIWPEPRVACPTLAISLGERGTIERKELGWWSDAEKLL